MLKKKYNVINFFEKKNLELENKKKIYNFEIT